MNELKTIKEQQEMLGMFGQLFVPPTGYDNNPRGGHGTRGQNGQPPLVHGRRDHGQPTVSNDLRAHETAT